MIDGRMRLITAFSVAPRRLTRPLVLTDIPELLKSCKPASFIFSASTVTQILLFSLTGFFFFNYIGSSNKSMQSFLENIFKISIFSHTEENRDQETLVAYLHLKPFLVIPLFNT
jgi:hypothetical protein